MSGRRTEIDVWGESVAATSRSSVEAWNAAWNETLHFVGDPFARLAEANSSDSDFALGSVFCATYRLLGGASPGSAEVQADLERARTRASDRRELGHVDALTHLANGNFTRAGERWDDVAGGTHDLAAVRFAHDVYLHVGDAARRLRSTERAIGFWGEADPGWGFVAGQHSFSLEEAGFYDDAERIGWRALDADPLDLWALHSLAHVYESTENQVAALDLLRSREDTWSKQDSLAVHVWWHLMLRLIAAREFDEVLSIHDRLVPEATTPYRLGDLASTLWRLELAGVDVGDRWGSVTDAFARRPERHTAGFIDLHMALAFSRCPDHPQTDAFFDGVGSSHRNDDSENGDIFQSVVRPLVEAVRSSSTDRHRALQLLNSIDENVHRIGGSVAQRDLITLTKSALETS